MQRFAEPDRRPQAKERARRLSGDLGMRWADKGTIDTDIQRGLVGGDRFWPKIHQKSQDGYKFGSKISSALQLLPYKKNKR